MALDWRPRSIDPGRYQIRHSLGGEQCNFDAFLLSKSKQIVLQTTSHPRTLSVLGLARCLKNTYHNVTNNASLLSFSIAPPRPSSANCPPTLPGLGLSSSCFYWIMVIVSVTHPQRMWKLTSLAAPLIVESESGVKPKIRLWRLTMR